MKGDPRRGRDLQVAGGDVVDVPASMKGDPRRGRDAIALVAEQATVDAPR